MLKSYKNITQSSLLQCWKPFTQQNAGDRGDGDNEDDYSCDNHKDVRGVSGELSLLQWNGNQVFIVRNLSDTWEQNRSGCVKYSHVRPS